MDLSDLITPYSVVAVLTASSKKQVLQELSHRAAQLTGLEEASIFQTLMQREKLGSTGVGNGIAIPHGKMAGLSRITGLFAKLSQPIDFEAVDDAPVDVVFVLLAPEGAGADHLKALARISRLLRDTDAVEKLRSTEDRETLYSVLTTTATPHAA